MSGAERSVLQGALCTFWDGFISVFEEPAYWILLDYDNATTNAVQHTQF